MYVLCHWYACLELILGWCGIRIFDQPLLKHIFSCVAKRNEFHFVRWWFAHGPHVFCLLFVYMNVKDKMCVCLSSGKLDRFWQRNWILCGVCVYCWERDGQTPFLLMMSRSCERRVGPGCSLTRQVSPGAGSPQTYQMVPGLCLFSHRAHFYAYYLVYKNIYR